VYFHGLVEDGPEFNTSPSRQQSRSCSLVVPPARTLARLISLLVFDRNAGPPQSFFLLDFPLIF